MRCEEAKPLLVFLGDGSLGPAEEMEVREHLDRCASCRSEHARLNALFGAVREVFPEPGRSVDNDFLLDVRERIRRKRSERVMYRRVFAAAAVLIVIAGSLVRMGYNDRADVALHPDGETGGMAMERAMPAVDEDTIDLASQYLETEDLYELVDAENTVTEDEVALVEQMARDDMLTLSTTDMMDVLDSEQVAYALASF